MRTRVRMWRVVKWGGLALMVILAVAWIGSGWVRIYYVSQDATAFGSLAHGQIGAFRAFSPSRTPSRGWQVFVRDIGDFELRPRINLYFKTADWNVKIPLWLPLVILFWPTALAWSADSVARRRALIGKCSSCGYDRAGLAEGAACPECGGKA